MYELRRICLPHCPSVHTKVVTILRSARAIEASRLAVFLRRRFARRSECRVVVVFGEYVCHHRHLLLLLGGLSGIEAAVDADESVQTSSDKTHQLFDMYVNTCSPQGARTIRTEEALLISLSALRMKMQMPE